MSAMDERRQEINKKRWERWRAQQNKEREKSYFHCWGEWSDYCGGSDEATCVTLTMSANYNHPTPVRITYGTKFCTATGQVGCGVNIYSGVDTRISAVGGGWSSDWQRHYCWGCSGVSGTHSHGIPSPYQGTRMLAFARAPASCTFVTFTEAKVECEVG